MIAEVDVKNTGHVAGDEVVQLYLKPPTSANGGLSPRVQIEGFQRIRLLSGEQRKVTFRLTPRELSEVDAAVAP